MTLLGHSHTLQHSHIPATCLLYSFDTLVYSSPLQRFPMTVLLYMYSSNTLFIPLQQSPLYSCDTRSYSSNTLIISLQRSHRTPPTLYSLDTLIISHFPSYSCNTLVLFLQHFHTLQHFPLYSNDGLIVR